MIHSIPTLLRSALPLLCLWLALCPAHAAGEPIGRTLSVTPRAWVNAPGKHQELLVKDFVYLSDEISTEAAGKVQILFKDNTTVSIAPNSRAKLSEFVYTEDGKANFAMNITTGVARVVTGMIVKRNPEGFKVITPQAVIGIRGTDCTVMTEGNSTKVIANRITTNDIQITNSLTGQTSSITKTGMAVEATPGGNMERQATEAERSTATQATRRQGEQQAASRDEQQQTADNGNTSSGSSNTSSGTASSGTASNGKSGSQRSVAQNGGQTSSSTTGAAGATGTTGAAGATGTTGAAGATGATGATGTTTASGSSTNTAGTATIASGITGTQGTGHRAGQWPERGTFQRHRQYRRHCRGHYTRRHHTAGRSASGRQQGRAAHTDSHTHAHADPQADAGSDADAYSYADTDSQAGSDAYADTDS